MPRKRKSRLSTAAQLKWKQRREESEEQRQGRQAREKLRRKEMRLQERERQSNEQEYLQRQMEEDTCKQLPDQHEVREAALDHRSKSHEAVLAARCEYARRRRTAETPEQKEARRARDRQHKRIMRAKLLQDHLYQRMRRASETPEQKEARRARDKQCKRIVRAKMLREYQAAQDIPSSPPHYPRAGLPDGTKESTKPRTEVEEVYIKPEPQEQSESREVYVEPDIKMETLESEDPGEEDGHSDPLEMSQYLVVSLEEGHSHSQPQDSQHCKES